MQEPRISEQDSGVPLTFKDDVQMALIRYVADEVLDGKDISLDATTPLLEWGVVNSLEIVKLINFIRSRFNISIPSDKVTAEHFQNLHSLANLVVQLAA